MTHPNIEGNEQIQPDEEQGFFDTGAVQTAHPVVPLAQIQNESFKPKRRFRVPMRAAGDGRLSPLVMALILLPTLVALGAVGTLIYNSQSKDDWDSAPEINKTVIEAEQIDIKPISEKNNETTASKNSLVSTTQKKDSSDEANTNELKEETEQQQQEKEDFVQVDKVFENPEVEKEVEKVGQKLDDDGEIQPEIKRDKKQEKAERKNKRDQNQNRDFKEFFPENEGN